MNYLFFDCEFSNCFNGIEKICELGYVITDSSFRVLSKRDILINPGQGGRFYLKGRNKHCDCELSHKEEEYFASKIYPYYYGILKSLFFKNNTIVFGYGVESDLKAIDNNNRRYKLKPFNIKAYDIQLLYKKYKKGGRNIRCSLDFVSNELIDSNDLKGFIMHNPTSDAYASMLILKKLTKLFNKPLTEILGLNKDTKLSLMEESIKRREKNKQKAIDQERLHYYRSLYDKRAFHCFNLPLKGKSFWLSTLLMKDTLKAVELGRQISFNGGVIKKYSGKLDYIVCLDNEDKEKMSSTVYFNHRKAIFVLKDDIPKMIAQGL